MSMSSVTSSATSLAWQKTLVKGEPSSRGSVIHRLEEIWFMKRRKPYPFSGNHLVQTPRTQEPGLPHSLRGS